MKASKFTCRGRGGRDGHEPRPRIRTRELRALELSIQGWTQPQIAGDLGITQPAVSKILRRAEERVLRELTVVVERQKARHTLRLEHVYGEGIRAWSASKADATRRRQRKTDGGSGDTATVAEITVESQHGDPRYLEVARKALADLRKLWGIDAPQKLDVRAASNPYLDMSEAALREAVARQTQLLGVAPSETIEPITTDATAVAPATSTSTTATEKDTTDVNHP